MASDPPPIGQFTISADELTTPFERDFLSFTDTSDLAPREQHFGQTRAVEAIKFGIDIEDTGYNIFVLGSRESAQYRLVEKLLRDHAAQQALVSDWCYVNNFADPQKPLALELPNGKGSAFCTDMHELIEELQLAIAAVFEGDDYRNQLKAIEQRTHRDLDTNWQALEKQAAERKISIMQTPTGYVLAPIRNGKVLSDAEFEQLPEQEREQVEQTIEFLSKQLQQRIESLPEVRKKQRAQIRNLNREVMAHTVSMLLREMKSRYADFTKVVEYLYEVERDIVENAQDFREQPPSPLPFIVQKNPTFERYEVNLIVSGDSSGSAPVVYEPNPSYPNVIGRIEYQNEMGALFTDFRMIRAGALHLANGGYLILDMGRVLSRPFVWEALKQALFAEKIRIESPGESYGLISTATLQPEPIPLKVKVVLLGERWMHELMSIYDSEFGTLFRIAADVDDDLPRTEQSVNDCVHLIAEVARNCALKPFSRDAVEVLVKQRARDAGDSERLSAKLPSLEDLMRQSDHYAKQRGAAQVESVDVASAIKGRIFRHDRVHERLLDAIQRDVLLIDTQGACVGQINGLAVVAQGDYYFGYPTRITAVTRLGVGEVVDIESKTKLGGKIHSKGMMILSAAMAARYAADAPLSLQASIVFEQSYSGVEGDSASVAELCALLSSLSNVPIKQNLAVTGSVNQLGRVQVIGGINEKIEGFFDVCKARGLDGTHGVVMPRDNVKHLVLREDVIEAVRSGKFALYAVRTIDEAITLLTGEIAGERGDDGQYPQGTLNCKVEARLREFAALRQSFGRDLHGNNRVQQNNGQDDE